MSHTKLLAPMLGSCSYSMVDRKGQLHRSPAVLLLSSHLQHVHARQAVQVVAAIRLYCCGHTCLALQGIRGNTKFLADPTSQHADLARKGSVGVTVDSDRKLKLYVAASSQEDATMKHRKPGLRRFEPEARHLPQKGATSSGCSIRAQGIKSA